MKNDDLEVANWHLELTVKDRNGKERTEGLRTPRLRRQTAETVAATWAETALDEGASRATVAIFCGPPEGRQPIWLWSCP